MLLMLAGVEVSSFVHSCEGDAVTKLTHEKVPYFNAPIYLKNKTQIGKVDEIFGPINESVSPFDLCCYLILCNGWSFGDLFFFRLFIDVWLDSISQ